MSIITDYLHDAIVITPTAGHSGDGRYTYSGTTVSTTARLVEKEVLERDVNGDQVVFHAMAFLKPTENVGIGDKITFGSDVYEVRKVPTWDFLTGTANHKTAMLVKIA